MQFRAALKITANRSRRLIFRKDSPVKCVILIAEQGSGDAPPGFALNCIISRTRAQNKDMKKEIDLTRRDERESFIKPKKEGDCK